MWTDDDDERPPLPNDVDAIVENPEFLAWFRARVASLKPLLELQHQELKDEILGWYIEEPARYITWVPEEAFRGKGYAPGAWKVLDNVVLGDLKDGIHEARRRIARRRDPEFASLDDWLRAEVSGALFDPGDQGGSDQLPMDTTNSLKCRAWVRRLRWPRNCSTCGESFKPTRSKARRCDACLSKRKAGKLLDRPSAEHKECGPPVCRPMRVRRGPTA